MSFRFFAGMGKSFFSRAKVPTFKTVNTPFMNKMVHQQIVNIVTKTSLPISSTGFMLRNLTELLEKKQSTTLDIEGLMQSLVAVGVKQGMINCMCAKSMGLGIIVDRILNIDPVRQSIQMI